MPQTITAGDETPQDRHDTAAAPADPATSVDPTDLAAPVRFSADSPTALLAVIPHLLGFVPQASLVVIGIESSRQVRITLRYDLPDPSGIGIAADLAAHAIGVICSQQITAMVVVGYGSQMLVDPLAVAVKRAAGKACVELQEFLRAENDRYWSYVCEDDDCCPAAGMPYEARPYPASATEALEAQAPGANALGSEVPRAKVTSAKVTRAKVTSANVPGAKAPGAEASRAKRPVAEAPGTEVLPDRAAVAARIAPLSGIAAVSMHQATRRAERHVTRLLAKTRTSSRLGAVRHLIASEGLAAVSSLITSYRGGGRFTTDYQLARMTVALRDLRVRDDAWARMDPAYRDAHRRLWIDAIRRAQPGYVAAPAALLAFVAWQSGDGALANVSLDRGLADDPRYSMALLLRQVISAGAPPSLARLPMTPEEVAASYDDAEMGDEMEDDDHEADQYVHDLDDDDEL